MYHVKTSNAHSFSFLINFNYSIFHFYHNHKMLSAYLQEVLVPLLAGGGSAAAAFHLSDLALQFGSGPFAVPEPALGVSQPQKLLLQETVLPLQQSQLPDGRPRRDLCALGVSPGQASQRSSRRHRHGIVGLQQQLQDGVLFNDGSLQTQERYFRKSRPSQWLPLVASQNHSCGS